MPRIAPLNHASATGASKDLLDAVKAKLGGTPNILTTMAHSPAVLKSYLDLSGNLGGSSLSAKVREQIALAVGNANGCGYCVAAHTAIGKGAGLTAEQAVAAQRGEAGDAKTQAILDLALAITEKKGWITDADYSAAKSAGVTEVEAIEVLATVVLNIFTNYFNHLVGTEIDFPKAELIETSRA
jgi:uncharacterized peroxidase-related enzyme